MPIRGDIACEVLDIEQVYVGDPQVEDIQRQPYILIAQHRPVEELQRMHGSTAAGSGGISARMRADRIRERTRRC